MTNSNCIFCEQPFGPGRKRSKEHAIPKWVAKALPGEDARIKHIHTPFLDPADKRREWVTKGYSLVAKVVCKPCNEGWMEQTIETPAKPHLWPMIQGQPVTLMEGASERVAYWGLKTAMMVDLTRSRDGNNVPPETYPELFAAKNVLSNTFVWLGVWDVGWDGHARNGMLQLDLDERGLTPMWLGLIGVGHLIILVIRVQGEYGKGLEIGGKFGPALQPVWPVSGPVTWPPSVALDRTGLEKLPILVPIEDALKPC